MIIPRLIDTVSMRSFAIRDKSAQTGYARANHGN